MKMAYFRNDPMLDQRLLSKGFGWTKPTVSATARWNHSSGFTTDVFFDHSRYRTEISVVLTLAPLLVAALSRAVQ